MDLQDNNIYSFQLDLSGNQNIHFALNKLIDMYSSLIQFFFWASH